jgi:hypothetical protein
MTDAAAEPPAAPPPPITLDAMARVLDDTAADIEGMQRALAAAGPPFRALAERDHQARVLRKVAELVERLRASAEARRLLGFRTRSGRDG